MPMFGYSILLYMYTTDMNYPLVASVFDPHLQWFCWHFDPDQMSETWITDQRGILSFGTVNKMLSPSWFHRDSCANMCAYLLACWYPHVCADQKSCRLKLLGKNRLQNTADAKQTPNLLPSNTTTMRPVAFSDLPWRKWIFMSLWIIIAFVGMELTSIWNHQEVQVFLLLLTTKGNLPRCQHGIQELLHTPPHHGTHQSMLFCWFIKKKHGFSMVFPYDFGCFLGEFNEKTQPLSVPCHMPNRGEGKGSSSWRPQKPVCDGVSTEQ